MSLFSRAAHPRTSILPSDDIEIELTAGDGMPEHAWFKDENGKCILHLSLSPAADPSQPASGSDSVSGVLRFKVSELCDYVDQLVELQEARISSTESYVEQIRQIDHRFLVLELQHVRHPTPASLRLDRRRAENTSVLGACMPFAKNEANDQARFTITGDVTQPGKRENRQKFEQQPTLRHLRDMLHIICRRLGGYNAWPNNCWLFCSVLQQLLESAHEGSFEQGELPKRGIGRSYRRRIYRDYLKVVCDARSAAEQKNLQHTSQQLSQEAHLVNRATSADVASQSSPIIRGAPSSEQQSVPGSSRSGGLVSDLPSTCIQRPPSVSHVIPNTGPVVGGAEVAVLGLNFPPSSRCFFGSEEATITQWDGGWLACILPQSKEPGPVDVTIRSDESVIVTSPRGFTYQDASPTHRQGL